MSKVSCLVLIMFGITSGTELRMEMNPQPQAHKILQNIGAEDVPQSQARGVPHDIMLAVNEDGPIPYLLSSQNVFSYNNNIGNLEYISICDVNKKVSWYEANEYCINNFGTSLASIHSDEDDKKFKDSRVCPVYRHWIGLNIYNNENKESNYVWNDGSEYNYELDWYQNAPDNNNEDKTCVWIHGIGWNQYDDRICDSDWAYAFTCWKKIREGSEDCSNCDEYDNSYFFNKLEAIDASRSNLIGSVSISNQIELSFDMKLNEYPSEGEGYYSILHIGNKKERSPAYFFRAHSDNSIAALHISLSDSNTWNNYVNIYPDDFKFELNIWYNIKLTVCNGVVTHYINNKEYKSYSNALITQRTDAPIHVGSPWAKSIAPVTIKNLIVKPCVGYDTGCDYTNECKAHGDPHIRTFDNTLYHPQGEGYFDYIKSCGESLYLPFSISAKHYQCRSTRTCIGEVIVSLENNKIISFPMKGNPKFKDSSNNAIGSHLFIDNNGKLVKYTVNNYKFEIFFFNNNNEIEKFKFYYKGTLLKVSTTDCLKNKNKLCGLCGNINDDPVDDFTRCDNGEIIDNTNVGTTWSGQPWINTHIYGESCCNKDLDDKYIGNSDCGIVIEPPEPIDESCLLEGESICRDFYNSYCKVCESDSNASEEWIDDCSFDMCADEECKKWILEGGFTVEDGINTKCLETSVDYCVDAFYSVLVNKAAQLDYQL